MSYTKADYAFMARAIQLARKSMYTTHPNPNVGCIFVKDHKIIAEGWHQYAGGPHAEINALNNTKEDISGASCYVSLEPCCHTGRTPPCVDALIEAGISQLYIAMLDPNPLVAGRGLERAEQAGIKTDTGLLELQAASNNKGYILRRTANRPRVTCKMAISLDGKTALNNGESKWITSSDARLDVQRLRASSSAIMTGIGTVLADDPSLTVREIDLQGRQPVRVVIDPELKFPPTAKMLQLPGQTLIFTKNNMNKNAEILRQAGAEVINKAVDRKDFLMAVLKHLAMEKEINEVLLEAGASLAGSMLEQGLIDELILYQAPVLMGNKARSMLELPEFNSMQEIIQLDMNDIKMVGKDIRISLKSIIKV